MSAAETKKEVDELLRGIDRYNPENLAILEKYVALQVKENVYDCEANLAVLKLYQFVPNCFQTDIAGHILLKAMTNLPHTDFALCKYLIDFTRLEEEPLSTIVNMGNLLEGCDFKKFWEELSDHPDIIIGVQGFEKAIREFIGHVVSITYQRIPKSLLMDLLNLHVDDQLEEFIKAKNFQQPGKDNMVFIANHEESIKSKNIKEKITFEGISAISSVFRPTKFGS